MARKKHDGVSEQSKAAKHRRKDAQVLFDGGRWRGAMYMAGYAVECLLKVKLMRKFGCVTLAALDAELLRRGTLPAGNSVYTHALVRLLDMSGSRDRLKADKDALSALQYVNRWIPAWRYTSNLSGDDEARAFLDAVDRLTRWIEGNL